MREGMYVSVMCSWTCACLFASVLIHSLTLIVSGHCLPSCLITPSRFLCIRKYAQTSIASTLSQDIDTVGEGERERKKVGRVGKREAVFLPSPRALFFQKCLGLHSSTSAPLGLSAAS